MVEIRTLGGFSLRVDGQIIEKVGSHKAEAILVYLAVTGRSYDRNVLEALLWPENSQEQASSSLRVALSILKKHLGKYLYSSHGSIGIKPDAKVYLDISDLEGELDKDQINAALEIYRGDFLEGFQIKESSEFENWLQGKQTHIRELFAGALHETANMAIHDKDYLCGAKLIRKLLELDPLDEVAHQQSLLLHALNGQRLAAIAQHKEFSELLGQELGVEPSPKTRKLYEMIVKGEEVTSLSLAMPPNNLPTPMTSFIGRDKEILKLRNLIRDPACRLLSLIGMGGSGKTRLAVQTALKAFRFFPDGTIFVELDAHKSAETLISAITNVLKFNVDTFASDLDPKTQLMDYLRNRSILFVLDGFEQYIEGAGLLAELLEFAPKIKILVTSRQLLGLKGEWPFYVEGLPTNQNSQQPQKDVPDAMQLFLERSRQAMSGSQVSEEDYGHVIRICELVEGLPLGIELAAAWCCVLTPLEIAKEIGNSLDILSTSHLDIPKKHRSIQAVFDSIWTMLTDEQKKMFSKLSVFQGGFDRQAALDVAMTSMTHLLVFQNKALLKKSQDGYFSMHGLLRQFATEKLSKNSKLKEDIQNRFCHYYVNLLLEREKDFMGSGMLQARDAMQPEIKNVLTAVNWACLNWESETVRKVLNALLSFYTLQGWHEGMNVLNQIGELREKDLRESSRTDPWQDAVFLCARTHQAFLQTNLGQIDESDEVSKGCLAGLTHLGLNGELSECMHNLGVNTSFRGEYENAKELLEKAVLLGRHSDHFIWPTYLLWLGHIYFLLGEYEQGLISLQKSYEIFEKTGTLWGSAFALSKMGLAMDGLGEHTKAKKYHQDAFLIHDRLGNMAGKGYSISRMSMSAYFLEEYQHALELGQEGYTYFKEINHRWGLGTTLCHIGYAYFGLGEIEKAKQAFFNALKQSRQNQMLPVSLYALSGLACVLKQQGEIQEACEIYQYIKHNPKTSKPYLEQALRWVGDFEQADPKEGKDGASSSKFSEDQIDKIIACYFN